VTSAPYAHIACCMDDSPGSERALEEARRLRGFRTGRLTIVHVAPAPIIYGESLGLPPEDEIADVASAWLTETARGIDGADPVLLSGHAGSAACAWASQAGVDLLVAGAHRGRLARLALGSFASYVAYHAPCPVLLVRPDTR
jgi:nucleotide-binding universal stress UspA family protein